MPATMFQIKLHKQNSTYTPGELISGEVILELNKTKNFRGVRLKFKGKANVKWTQRGSRNRRIDYTAEEEYFKSEIYALGDTESRIELTPGRHIFPFTFNLPTNIPNSFDHKLGKIKYTITAVIDKPWKLDEETEIAFSVYSPLDLSRHCSVDINDDVKTNYCNPICPCIGEGSMQAEIHVPHDAYEVGEALEVMISLNNTSTVPVRKIKLLLEQKMEFVAHSPSKKTKKKKTILAQAKQPGPFPPSTAVKLGIQIPTVIHSHLPHCGIIDIKYRAVVIIGASGCHFDTVKKYDIMIGSKMMPRTNFSTDALPRQPEYNPSAPLYAPVPSSSGDHPVPFPMPYPMNPSYEPAILPYPPAAPSTLGFQVPSPSAPIDTTSQPPPPSYDDVMKSGKS